MVRMMVTTVKVADGNGDSGGHGECSQRDPPFVPSKRQGSPIFHSSCEGELGIALQSLQGKRDLI